MSTSLRQILVHFDPTDAAPRRLAAARQLAARTGAAVTALYAVAPPYLQMPAVPSLDPSLMDTLEALGQERRDKARRAFDEVLRADGPPVAWAETHDTAVLPGFGEQALYADLLVLGQHDPNAQTGALLPPDFAESVTLATGRPALIIPYIGAGRTVGENPVIAWKPTREAARAVSAAMPVLQAAGRAHVLTFGEEEDGGSATVNGARLDIGSYLRAHGVEPVFHNEPEPRGPVGELLLSRVADLGADLLVMGCYGHTRTRELIMGGVSRTVLRSMTVPVLMVH